MSDPVILFSSAEGIARITLNRPDRLNSLNADMKNALREHLGRVANSTEARVLLISGSGRAFCSGQDLAERRRAPGEEPPDLRRSVSEFWTPLVKTITGLRVPVVCAVNGVAAGAGMNLALACDIVIAARSAKFIQSFSKIGLIPDCGGTYFLPRLAGPARAMATAMLATPVSAEQAEHWGLIWKCVDDDQLPAEAENMVRHLSCQPTRGLGLLKQALRMSLDHSLSEQLDIESELQGLAGQTQDYREGVAAFFEKRPAVFTGN